MVTDVDAELLMKKAEPGFPAPVVWGPNR